MQKCFKRTLRRTECVTTWSMRSQALAKPAERWRQPSQDGCAMCARKKSAQNYGRLRKFIVVDTYEAVNVGDLDKNVESRKVVKPKFTTNFRQAVVREGAEKLTLRCR